VSISGQNPRWFVNVNYEDKVKLFDAIRVIEVVVCSQIKVANNLISSWVACRSQVYWSKILCLNEDDPVLIRDGYIHLGDTLSIFSVGRWSVSLPKLEGEVLKGVTAEVLPLDCLS
jgi:hypothetical protein